VWYFEVMELHDVKFISINGGIFFGSYVTNVRINVSYERHVTYVGTNK